MNILLVGILSSSVVGCLKKMIRLGVYGQVENETGSSVFMGLSIRSGVIHMCYKFNTCFIGMGQEIGYFDIVDWDSMTENQISSHYR